MKEFLNTELKPYNELTREEKHILLDAHINKELEVYNSWTYAWVSKDDETLFSNSIYRTKPKEYKKLDIPWQVIDEKWNYAAIDNDDDIYVFEYKPTWSKTYWEESSDDGDVTCIYDILKLDTTGIVAEHSLTQRPERSDIPEGV